jgi:conjugative transposon TraM protein
MTTEEKTNQPFSQQGNSSNKALAFKRKIKMLMVLPLLVLPFATLAFWALDGGSEKEKRDTLNAKEGLNLQLPAANLKPDDQEDKLSFYEKAKEEEEKNQEAMRNDPYLRFQGVLSDSNELDDIVANDPAYGANSSDQGLNPSPIHSGRYKDPNEEKIMRRINQLQQQMNEPATDPAYREELPAVNNRQVNIGGDVDRLEQMMKMLQEKKEDDPEMQTLQEMLDKILDIQHPERVKDRIKEKSLQQKRSVFPVLRNAVTGSSSLLTADTNEQVPKGKNAFYGLSENTKNEQGQNAVEAVVHETQLVVNGSKIKLRLLNDIYINGTLIPKGNILFAEVSINDQRMHMEIHSIVYNHSIFPVQLTVYDVDGLAGIHIPDGNARDVVKQGADNGLQGMELTSLNPSIAAQATAASINTVKSLLSKKVKQLKIMVKSGYKLLLVNADSGQ